MFKGKWSSKPPLFVFPVKGFLPRSQTEGQESVHIWSRSAWAATSRQAWKTQGYRKLVSSGLRKQEWHDWNWLNRLMIDWIIDRFSRKWYIERLNDWFLLIGLNHSKCLYQLLYLAEWLPVVRLDSEWRKHCQGNMAEGLDLLMTAITPKPVVL